MTAKASSTHKLAVIGFVASLAAYLVTAALAATMKAPAILGGVRLAALATALVSLGLLAANSMVWAIARNTIAQAVRVRVAFVIMAVYLVLVPAIPFVVKGDGTLRGLLHVVVAYSLIVAGMLLGVLTLAISTTTLWSEFREKQIFLLESKPIRRWQVLLGKLVGILLINVALLAFMGAVTWGSVAYLASRTEWNDKAWTERSHRDAREQVLIARRTLLPDLPPQSDLDDFVRKNLDWRVQEIERNARLPQAALDAPDPATRKAIIRREAANQLAEELLKLINAVRPLYTRRWHFSDISIPRQHDTNLTLRFKFFSSDRKSEEPDHVRWEFGVPNRTKAYRYDEAFLPDEVHEVQIPADTVDAEGGLEVRFTNVEPRRPTLIFSEADSLQVLVPVGGFGWNLARGLALIFIEVLFIAVLGLFCSTFLSFPVSPIVALSVLLLIFLVNSIRYQFEKGFTMDQNKESTVAQIAEKATRIIAAVAHTVLPPFDKYSPSALVSSGEEVSPGMLLDAGWSIALAHGGLLMLAGAYIFERREIATTLQ